MGNFILKMPGAMRAKGVKIKNPGEKNRKVMTK